MRSMMLCCWYLGRSNSLGKPRFGLHFIERMRVPMLAWLNAALVQQWPGIADREKYPKIAMLMDGCEDEVLARTAFPKARRRQLRDTNPLERLNAEIKRRTDAGLRGGHGCEANLGQPPPSRDA
ncbi:hypothetical protein CHN49_14055 [Pseudomonas putida]|nr:hypothetical protein CHN49_14055 [Pseudomonas putida]